MVHVQQILKEYLELHGYWVLFVGTFLEGEAILLLAGLLAFQGYLNVFGVISTAWAGSFAGDQFYFYLGYSRGRWLLKRFHSIARKFREALRMIEKYGTFVAFISRFTYGFRIVLPIILGITNLAPRTFLLINLISALVWAVTFSLGGYLFGKSASLVLDNISNYEQYLVLILFGFIFMAWCVHGYHVWKLKKPARERLARILGRTFFTKDTFLNNDIVIILVEPQSPGNIGMACRAMKNMGFTQLRIVNGCDRFHPEALKFAVAARDLLEAASVFPDLASAMADCTLAVGTTRRHGKYRQEILSPSEVASHFRELVSPECRAALVFGREDNGLTTEELSLCRWHATIPTSTEYGSLNLAQSVLLFCYELGKAAESAGGGRPLELANSAEMETFFSHFRATLDKIGFLNEQNPAHMMRSLRRIFFRANLDSREVTVLRGMLTQIDWASSAFDGRKRS